MDGENNGNPYVLMDDLGYHYFWKHPYQEDASLDFLPFDHVELLPEFCEPFCFRGSRRD